MNALPRIALLGDSGQVGWELARSLNALGTVATVRDHEGLRLELSDPRVLGPYFDAIEPDIVVNAAAYTAVDAAEDDVHTARRVNTELPAWLARYCATHDALLVHYSTDYVFAGDSASAYRETDVPRPENVYGETKLAGERRILDAQCRTLIFRASWVYSARRNNFLRTMLRLIDGNRPLRVVSDQLGSPTSARAIADATTAILAKGLAAPPGWLDKRLGLYHMSASGHTTWYAFTCAIIDETRSSDYAPGIVPITTNEYPTTAARPANSRLNNEAIRAAFSIELADWRIQLIQTLEDMGLRHESADDASPVKPPVRLSP